MTFEDLKTSDKLLLTVEEVASVTHIAAMNLRDQARKNPAYLGFPVIVSNDTVRVPRIPFIKYMEGTL